MNIDWNIGDVIAKLRRARRMNQTVLADRVGVNKATIVRAEDGDPKVSRETYLLIAEVLGTDMVSLEVESARLQGKGAHGISPEATFREWDGKEERRTSADRRVARNG